MNNFYRKLGMRIKNLRKETGLSQKKLAGSLGMSRVPLSQIENGGRKINADEIAKLAKIFNITTDALLDLKQNIKVVLEKKKKFAQARDLLLPRLMSSAIEV